MSYKRRRGLGGARTENPTKHMGPGQRRALVTLVIVVGCIGAGYLISSLLISPSAATADDGSVVHVPDLVGLAEADARARATEAGLELTVRGGLAHREIPEGAVLAQSPLADQFARPGAPVQVTLSRGPEVHTLPDVAGLSERQAVIVLERLGYEVEIERREDALARGRAVETRPEAGSELEVPSLLVLVVSEGAPIVVVPDMLGLHIDDALQVLTEYNLELGSISFDEEAPEAPGRIVGQYPPVGYSLRAGDAVELRVAGDPDQVNRDPGSRTDSSDREPDLL